MKSFNRSASQNSPRPEDYPLGSLESRMAMRAVLDSSEKEIIEIIILGPCGGRAQYVVGKSGLSKISGSLPTREQFEAAYQALQRERFGPKGMIDGAESLPRSENAPQPQCGFEQPDESDHAPQKVTVDPLAAVHRRRR